MFRLFECFMESAPQLVLQIYILIKDPHAIRLMDDGNRFVEGKRECEPGSKFTKLLRKICKFFVTLGLKILRL